MNTWINRINIGLASSFYLLFILVPLVVYPSSYELFEFNKMWVVFAITALVVFLWGAKMVIAKKLVFRRTPLDIPIVLFVVSQMIATIISIDSYVSFWGYYSRFNGGLLSTISYVILYYALASNLLGPVVEETKNIKHNKIIQFLFYSNTPFSLRLFLVALLSGTVVALWGLPSHFGYDPTCLMFRGELNVDCWTEAFQPTVRIFSLLGQPNWLAAYLSILLIPTIALVISPNLFKQEEAPQKSKKSSAVKQTLIEKFGRTRIAFAVLALLFYVDLVFTKSQSGFLGFWAGFIAFVALVKFFFWKRNGFDLAKYWKLETAKILALAAAVFIVLNLFIGFPIERLNNFTISNLFKSTTSAPAAQGTETALAELGGTNSGEIRLIVWQGTVDIIKKNPLFGTGVETFAFSYYQNRPAAHNLTSEWDYLYNKAHNEYLNYAATTGLVGLSTYLLMIGWFLFTTIRYLISKNHKSSIINRHSILLGLALVGSYASILVSNFFGFSVVLVNLLFFLIPLFVYDFIGHPSFAKSIEPNTKDDSLGFMKIIPLVLLGLVIAFMEITLLRYWLADKHYAMGYNLNRLDQQFEATQELATATKLRPSEPLFRDELAINLGTLSLIAAQGGQASQAAELAKQAKLLSDSVVDQHPNNVTYYKSRTRILYGLSQVDPKYLDEAIVSIEKAHTLAPQDAKIMYNRALIYEQKGDRNKAIQYLRESINLKKDYRDPYYALALLLAENAKELEGTDSAQKLNDEAKDLLNYSLQYIAPGDEQAQELLNTLN